MVAVFKKGWGADLLGLQRVDFVEAWVPLFLFAVLFGTSHGLPRVPSQPYDGGVPPGPATTGRSVGLRPP